VRVLADAGGEVEEEHALFALNGTVVALVQLDGEEDQGHLYGTEPPSPTASVCLGLGILRSIDPTWGEFHIITPVEQEKLEKCNCIVKGDLELPIALMLGNQGGSGQGDGDGPMPYLQLERLGREERNAGGGKRKIRRNLMRKGQM